MEDAYLMLAAAEGVSPGLIPSLLDPGIDPEELLRDPPVDLPKAALRRCRDHDTLRRRVASWRAQAAERRLSILTPASPQYPEHLRDAPLRPLVLFADGALDNLEQAGRSVAVIGSRTPTSYGRAAAADFASSLAADAGVSLWSGLAAGVDAIAHHSCIDAGVPTVAVLAGGFDHVYPAQHRGLFENIIRQGGLCISELPPDAKPMRGHFPRRNRILALAVGAVLVIEAGAASGSLHTARFAVDAGTPVFALPGPYTSPRSVGCHRLIADGAGLAADPESLLRELGVGMRGAADLPRFRHFEASADERAILDRLTSGPRPKDLLQRESRLDPPRYYTALVQLMEAGRVSVLEGGVVAARVRPGSEAAPLRQEDGFEQIHDHDQNRGPDQDLHRLLHSDADDARGRGGMGRRVDGHDAEHGRDEDQDA